MGERQDRAKSTNALVISYRTLQRLLGFLGLALPVALLVFSWAEGRPLEASISDFYYTKMGGYLGGTLCAVGVFLYCYNGFPEDRPRLFSDRTFATMAGVCAIGVALFPVHRKGLIPPPGFDDPVPGDAVTVFYGAVRHPDAFHYLSAALFFLCIFIFATVFFPKGEVGLTKRRLIYYLCGATMALSIARMAPYAFAPSRAGYGPHFLFIWESVAIVAFSVAWLAKGKIDLPLNDGLTRLMRKATPD